jgi:hypothetical protein
MITHLIETPTCLFWACIDSTLLSQCFAHQGIKISIRKERRVRRISKSNYDKKDDESSKEINKKKQNYRRIDILDFL